MAAYHQNALFPADLTVAIRYRRHASPRSWNHSLSQEVADRFAHRHTVPEATVHHIGMDGQYRYSGFFNRQFHDAFSG
jgi:hypothetical protein